MIFFFFFLNLTFNEAIFCFVIPGLLFHPDIFDLMTLNLI